MIFDKSARDEISLRLVNWGLWSRTGGIPNLNYPAWIDIMRDYFPADTRITPDSNDAEIIENVISTLNIAGRRGMGWGEVYQFILKMEYVEYGRPQSLKADHVRYKFKHPCSMRTYRYHLHGAKEAVYKFSGPL